MTIERFEAACRRASAALDKAWQEGRDLANEKRAVYVQTLSSSLAAPFEYQVEMTLSNARSLIQTDGDRDALVALARAAHDAGLIKEPALARLLKDYGVPS